MIKHVEDLRVGDVVSFAGSGPCRYEVTDVEIGETMVALFVKLGERRLTASYSKGENVRVHS